MTERKQERHSATRDNSAGIGPHFGGWGGLLSPVGMLVTCRDYDPLESEKNKKQKYFPFFFSFSPGKKRTANPLVSNK